ncbi:MAG: tetratricopeptide repeat protein [Myxococcota bacterium]|nr:tetratricopeptide repeat protein [Myxococcota bacterium]
MDRRFRECHRWEGGYGRLTRLAENNLPSPALGQYGTKDVVRLTRVSATQLRRWHRNGLLPAIKTKSGRLSYTFSDVVAVRAAKALLDRGVKTRQVRRLVRSIRDWRPDIEQPLATVRVDVSGDRVLIVLDGVTMETGSGQLVFNLDAPGPARPAQILETPNRRVNATSDHANLAFNEAQKAEKSGDLEAAEMGYRRAISLDPTHARAMCNLGNLIFATGRFRTAGELYRAATRADPSLSQAWYNLANALDELEKYDEAVAAYSECLRLNPGYADAHFNAGLLFEKQGFREMARRHWLAFIELTPDHHPAQETARAFLEYQD